MLSHVREYLEFHDASAECRERKVRVVGWTDAASMRAHTEVIAHGSSDLAALMVIAAMTAMNPDYNVRAKPTKAFINADLLLRFAYDRISTTIARISLLSTTVSNDSALRLGGFLKQRGVK